MNRRQFIPRWGYMNGRRYIPGWGFIFPFVILGLLYVLKTLFMVIAESVWYIFCDFFRR